jgi:hypothetical protein
MASVPGTLQSACDLMLREVIRELGNCKIERLGDETIYFDCVVTPDFVLNWTMVAVVIITLGDETIF